MCEFFMLRHLTSLPSNHNGLSLSSPSTFFKFEKSHTQVANMEYYENTINNNPNKLYIFEKVIK